jgi:hypothetical protein
MIDALFSASEIPGQFVELGAVVRWFGLTYLMGFFTDRAVLKITEEEFSRPPMDVRIINTGHLFFCFISSFHICSSDW